MWFQIINLSHINTMSFSLLRSFLILGICYSLIASSCKSDASTSIDGKLGQLESALIAEPTAENIKNYLESAKSFVTDNKEDKAAIKPVLQKASKISIDNNQPFSAISFLTPLIKDYPTDDKAGSYQLELAKLMQKVKKEHVAITLYKSYLSKNPGDIKDSNLDQLVATETGSTEAFVDTIMVNIFTNPNEFGLNKDNALKFVDVAEAYALANQGSDQSAQYLYKAAEVARSIRTFPKTLTIYDWLISDYPNYEKTPTVVFLKGFLLDNEQQNLELAKESYEMFIDRYPEHELASHVKFLIENLGKSDEEILELITNKKEEATPTQ